MKRILFALLCVACTGTAWAQSPLPTQPQPAVSVFAAQQGAPLTQVYGGRFVGSTSCAPSCAPACTPCCVPCCMATKTICVPECATKVTVKINYSSVCEKICFPKCSLFSCGCNSCCEQGHCDSHIYQKKYLVKRVCTTECPTTKCVAVEVPVCETRGGVFHRNSGSIDVAPTYVEPIPAPPTKR